MSLEFKWHPLEQELRTIENVGDIFILAQKQKNERKKRGFL
jgi:hypothetical protein